MADGRHLVIFDGDCAFCNSQVRLLRRLDWRRTLQFVPITESASASAAAGLDRAALQAAIHCLAADGSVYRGARAFRFIGLRLPLLAPLALLLWLPGALGLAEWGYARVSRNRHRLGRWLAR